MEYKNKRRLIIGIALLLLIVLYIFKNTSFLIRAVSVFVGLWVFYFVDYAFKLKFGFRHYFYFLIILVAGLLLSPFYYIFESYDKVLHFVMPVLGSILIFF
ncbi:unnamed protein product, partial [marine sediment metagenome]